ncbi:hypothetical protein PsorP6_000893 [Peronosclerospora sorghi]|uniref:Uncharacterized protein n=1 Tax=Peronosclerospora sorghi TaxID=230839 RepID=A0ACC0WV46_9STRA|nr:hypothetical protein PsorP6_000893 [Peronosclerospora sorghi]
MAAEELPRDLQGVATEQSSVREDRVTMFFNWRGHESQCCNQLHSLELLVSWLSWQSKQRKKRRRAWEAEADEVKAEETDANDTPRHDATVVEEAEQSTRLHVANGGDCRAVCCVLRTLKPSSGFVHTGRLDGMLQLSRGVGDLWPTNRMDMSSGRPTSSNTGSSRRTLFVLLARDGLFHVLTSQQAVHFVLRKLQTHGDVQLAAHESSCARPKRTLPMVTVVSSWWHTEFEA